MVQITGKYALVKSDNFKGYLLGIGVPEEKAEKAENMKPTYDIKQEGDKFCVKTEEMPNFHAEFILNQEVEEKMPDGYAIKTTTVMQGDKIIQTSKTPNGRSGTRTYTFNGNEVTIVYKDDDPKTPVATRVFKRL